MKVFRCDSCGNIYDASSEMFVVEVITTSEYGKGGVTESRWELCPICESRIRSAYNQAFIEKKFTKETK